MRKWLYFVLIVIIAGLFTAYYVAGVKAEKEFGIFLKSVNNTPNLKVVAKHYHRGWLKSTVHIDAKLHCPPQQYEQNGMPQTLPARDVPFSFNMAIYHGPIIFAENSIALGLGYAKAKVILPNEVYNIVNPSLVHPEQFSQIFSSTSIKPEVIVSLLLRYSGKMDINLDIPPFDLTGKEGRAEINWKGFQGHWMTNRKLSHIQGSVTFKGMIFKVDAANGNIGPVHLKYNVENKGNNILSGRASIKLKTFEIGANNKSVLDLDGLQVESSNQIKNKDNVQLVNSSLKADISSVTYQGLDYGPGVLDVYLSNLDAEALNQIQQKLQVVSNNKLTGIQQQMFMLTLLPELSRLLNHGAMLQVKQLQLSIPEGVIVATAKVKLPNQPAENQNPLQLIQKMDAHVMAEVPVAWLTERVTDFIQLKIAQRQLMEQQMANKANLTQHSQLSTTPASKNETPANVTNSEDAKLLSLQEMNALAKQQALEQLENLVQNGILIQKENVYRIEMTFKEGAFYINGKPFNNQQISEGVN